MCETRSYLSGKGSTKSIALKFHPTRRGSLENSIEEFEIIVIKKKLNPGLDTHHIVLPLLLYAHHTEPKTIGPSFGVAHEDQTDHSNPLSMTPSPPTTKLERRITVSLQAAS
ncbi:hypothetical protein DY000_02013154 [Brassica cretica]|uniref:Uncharacterized protein n=1 Tax=Brassica cretica TaxID=69181 RepID=A0ABQ7CQY3_BRACR|nr:hypothetical protein DY000_02013154 [Brassica cretica]